MVLRASQPVILQATAACASNIRLISRWGVAKSHIHFFYSSHKWTSITWTAVYIRIIQRLYSLLLLLAAKWEEGKRNWERSNYISGQNFHEQLYQEKHNVEWVRCSVVSVILHHQHYPHLGQGRHGFEYPGREVSQIADTALSIPCSPSSLSNEAIHFVFLYTAIYNMMQNL